MIYTSQVTNEKSFLKEALIISCSNVFVAFANDLTGSLCDVINARTQSASVLEYSRTRGSLSQHLIIA